MFLNRVSSRGIWIAAVFFWLAVWAAFLLWGWRAPLSFWAQTLPGWDLAEAAFGATSLALLHRDIAVFLALATGITGVAFLIQRYWTFLQEERVLEPLFSLSVAAGVLFVLAYCEYWYNYISPGYDIVTMMTKPETVAVFGQRLLFVWPAMLLKRLVPRVSYAEAFIAFQYVALFLAVYLSGVWSAMFIGRRMKFIGQLIMGMVLACTFGYYNGHDFGVVSAYTLCFILLYRRRYWWYVLVFCVGVLNHQNILLLIPTAFVIMWGGEDRSTVLRVGAVTVVAYFAIRAILNAALPIPQTHEIKVWWNIRQIAEFKKTMVMGALCMLPWYAFALLAWRTAEPFLKRASILLPMQLGVFFLYGQLNEVRIFNGFLPVMIGFWLCYLRGYIAKDRGLVLGRA